jgi:hypothetical protein
MNKFLAILLLMALLVPACATNEPAAVPKTQSQPVEAVKTDFLPTDPASVNLAAGKPQLIEFFAFW